MNGIEIVQGSNFPVEMTFSGDDPSTFTSLSITLWSSIVSPGESVGSLMKRWSKDDIEIDGYDLSLPLTQEETLAFVPGPCRFEMKWMRDDGGIDETDEVFGMILPFDDTMILE